MVKEISDQDFKSEVLDSNVLTLIDFWAPWCGPCKMLAPILEDISKEYADKVKIFKVDIDENPAIAGEYKVRAVPTLILFKEGKPIVDQKVGAPTKQAIIDWINNNI